jgi:predicted DNA-binding transcriptional regulator YafY
MPADTAADQLERILHILPAAARRDGVPIEVLAAQLGVDTATVLRDIEHVTARAFYHPAGAVETFSILLDGRTVEVHAPHEFKRPARLNQREALALSLGLRSLAADAGPERRAEIIAFASRVEAELSAPPTDDRRDSGSGTKAPAGERSTGRHSSAGGGGGGGEGGDDAVDYEEFALGFDDDGFRGVIADAIDMQRLCTIWYLKPGDVAPEHRSIAPYRLMYAEGTWYVAAWDVGRQGLRFFRMDRVLNAEVAADPAREIPASALDALLSRGVAYSAADDVEVRVRYSPRVARWVAERAAAPLESDGSIVLQHRVADIRWIVRHVLQYGGDAVVEAPEEARSWVAAAAADVASVVN